MNNVNLKHYVEVLRKGGRLVAKRYDDSELSFFLKEDGTLVSEDEHGLDTTTGLSDIELAYVLEMQEHGEYIIEEFEEEKNNSINTSSFDSNIERALLISNDLINNGYTLEEIYESYNRSSEVAKLIDNLCPEVLDILDGKNVVKRTIEQCKENSDLNLLCDNLFKSGRTIIWDLSGDSTEYFIEGGILTAISSNGQRQDGFLAATKLKSDLDRVALRNARAGIITPEIEFLDEKAKEKVEFGINTARIFSCRLGYMQQNFEREYNEDTEFRYGIDMQDQSIWYRADVIEPISMQSVFRDAISGVTKKDLENYDLLSSKEGTKEIFINRGEM